VARRVHNRVYQSARLLTAGGGIGGLLALLGAWLALKGPHSSLERASGAGELVMVIGLCLALICGLVAFARFGIGLIKQLDSERRPTRLKGPP